MNIGIYIHIYIQLHPVIYAIKKPKTPIGNIFGLHFSVSLIIQITGEKKALLLLYLQKKKCIREMCTAKFHNIHFSDLVSSLQLSLTKKKNVRDLKVSKGLN